MSSSIRQSSVPVSDPEPVSNLRMVALGVALCLVAVGVCVVVDRYGVSSRKGGEAAPVGVAPVAVTRVDTPDAAYRYWRDHNEHGRTILYIAAAWERIDPNQYWQEDPRRHYPLEVYRPADLIERNYLDRRDFLFVAALQGVARRVIAVVSPNYFRQALEQAKNAKNVRIGDGTIFMAFQGFPRWFVTPDHLFSPEEPVLLYVDATAFRGATPTQLLARLKEVGVRTDAALLCDDPGNPDVTPQERNALHEFGRHLQRGGA